MCSLGEAHMFKCVPWMMDTFEATKMKDTFLDVSLMMKDIFGCVPWDKGHVWMCPCSKGCVWPCPLGMKDIWMCP